MPKRSQLTPQKDWKLIKPRMHALAEDDPGPESSEFQSDVLCEHDGLSLNTASRRKISAEVKQGFMFATETTDREMDLD